MSTLGRRRWIGLPAFLIAGGIALALGRVAYQPFNIPSGSMLPTLVIGDYMLVSRFSYGVGTGRLFGGTPKRGDVVVFKNANAQDAEFVMRVVGVPGDHVQLRAGSLVIDGQAVARKARPGVYPLAESFGMKEPATEYDETLPGGPTYTIAKMRDDGPANTTSELVVPPGTVFVLGDNRDNTLDSRFSPDSGDTALRVPGGPGLVPLEKLSGRAALVVFSVDPQGSAIRWDRTLAGIH